MISTKELKAYLRGSMKVGPVTGVEMAKELIELRQSSVISPVKIYQIRKLDGSEAWAEWLEVSEAEYNADVINDGWERRILYTAPVNRDPEGLKLVPIEPTEQMMLNKSDCQHHAWDDPDCEMRQTRRFIWQHMIEATPAPGGGDE